MIKIGYFVKDKALIQTIWKMPLYQHSFLIYELEELELNTIKDLKIDVLIVDIYFEDILRVFEEIRERLNIKGIAVLCEYSDSFIELILKHHMKYVCDLSVSEKALYVMIMQVIDEYENVHLSIYDQIEQIAYATGIKHHLKGYEYLKSALLYFIENNQKEYRMKDVYDTIAKKHRTTSSRVEKNLRLAIHASGSTLSNLKFIKMCYREYFND